MPGVAGVRKSLARRLAVRALECLRFGFGMDGSLRFQFRSKLPQGVPAGIGHIFPAAALGRAALVATGGAEALTILIAKGAHGEPQQELLPNNVTQFQSAALIKTQVRVVPVDPNLLGSGDHRHRVIEQVELLVDLFRNGL
jgi:hypothetical protein